MNLLAAWVALLVVVLVYVLFQGSDDDDSYG